MDSELIKGTIPLLILSLLSRKPMYGYEITTTIREDTGGLFEWKEGTLYPNLHRLEKDGFIASRWEGDPGSRRRKYYEISDLGRKALAERRRVWADFRAAVEAILEKSDGQD